MINIFPIILLIITFWGVKAYGRSTSPDFFTLQQTKNIQGIACIFVILHHLVQQVSGYGVINKGPVTILNDTGIFFTAIFFFVSGYGLMISLETKPDYLDKFLLKRLPTVLIPFWIVNIIGVILNIFLYGPVNSPLENLFDILGLTLINSNGWFIIEITIFYIIFFILFKFIRKKDVALVLMILAVLVVISFSSHQGHDLGEKVHWFRGEWWYNSTITFAYGLVYGRFKKQLDSFFASIYYFILPLFTFLAVGMAYVCRYATIRYGYYGASIDTSYRQNILITLTVQSIGCIIFVTFILLLNMRFTIDNKVLRYLSSISMELFLVHGYFIHQIFGNLKINDFFRFCLVLLWSIVFTAILALATHFITRKFIKLVTTPKQFNDTVEGKILAIQHKKKVQIYTISLISVFVLSILFVLLGFFRREVFAQFEYNSEMKALANAQIGDEVYYGHYDLNYHIIGQERVPWIVIKKEDNSVCLLCKYGIAGSSFNQGHEEVNWETCDLRGLLNTEVTLNSFNKYEKYNLEVRNDDVFTILTDEEAREIFETDEDRLLQLCQSASFNGVNESLIWRASQNGEIEYRTTWWWLRRADDKESDMAPFVNVNGIISEKEVNRPDGAIRPVIWVKLEP